MKGIKTFADILKKAGKQSAEVTALLNYTGTDTEILNNQAFQKLKLVAKVLNGKWRADYNNWDQNKYYPVFEANESGFGFSSTDYDYWLTNACAGSRLVFATRAKPEFAGKTFEKEYSSFLSY